jgi:hypothetical protein
MLWLRRFAGDERRVLRARWFFLRGLGLIFLSAFGSYAAQVLALIGPSGILPARTYLEIVGRVRPGLYGIWSVPSLLWLDASDGMLQALVGIGIACSVLLFANIAPRWMCLACSVIFLSILSASRDFASYQSDGMLLEAGFASVLFAPRSVFPKLAASSPPTRAAHLLLLWEWFRIYFQSGVGKLASGEPAWRDLTAMDAYYERGPLPTWLSWHAHQLPHWVHAFSVLLTFFVELPLPILALAWRPSRKWIFAFVTIFQLGIIATANYAFLNYLVLLLGVVLVDDDVFVRLRLPIDRGNKLRRRKPLARILQTGALVLVVYASISTYAARGSPDEVSWLFLPARAIAPFRVADRYGLFAIMTPGRWEIEIQGSRDGVTWTPYPYRYKPQEPGEPPKIYAPYQPRFEWNLWFCSLGSWEDCGFLVATEKRLLENEPHVRALFREDPFHGDPPRFVRAVKWQYWFTDKNERAVTGNWWRRAFEGVFGPTLERLPDGTVTVTVPEETVTP